ncbi:dynein regulatory complex subunit 2 [Archocentrus centrarchus]|uniref:dynein regulatory complex subunit 2 n=1 Tax=Archocentrus centrarchus TaxID=63155 RepID=UPI0011E9FFB2|nr:dynein regulatory complex subunit 2 [Archocentrus centrarchus]
MSKKTKKSGRKSEEERQMLLQQRGQAEEELKEKKEEMLSLFLKDKLQEEQRNTVVTMQKINDGWREMLRLAQEPELRREIIICQQMFEKEMDDLDSIIKNNERDMQEMERWEAQVKSCHQQHMEALWALQAKRLLCLEQQWESSLQEIRSSWSSQRQQMLPQSQQLEVLLQNLKLTAEQQNKDALDDIKAFYEQTQMKYLKTLEEQMAAEEFREEVKEAIQRNVEGLQYSNKLSADIEDLFTESQKEMSKGLKIIKKLEKNICQLTTENTSKEEALTDAINEAKHKGQSLRKERIQAQKATRKKLTKLVMQGDAATKKLQTIIAKGERVLRCADICSKLERKHEALLSSSSSGPTDEASNMPAKDVCGFPELQQLERRISNAVLVREDLKKQKEELRRENRELKNLIDQHRHPPTLHVAPAPTMSTPPGASNGRCVINATHIILKRK